MGLTIIAANLAFVSSVSSSPSGLPMPVTSC